MKPHSHFLSLVSAPLALALILGLSACSVPSEKGTNAVAEVAEPFTDGEILQVLQTLNEGEIRQAELALVRSDEQEVRNIAQVIIRDHQDLEEQIREAHVEPEESALSEGLRVQAQELHEELSNISSPDFDCAYLTRQVQQHRIALETVGVQLKPDAQSTEVNAILEDAEKALERHEQTAHQIHSDTECGFGQS